MDRPKKKKVGGTVCANSDNIGTLTESKAVKVTCFTLNKPLVLESNITRLSQMTSLTQLELLHLQKDFFKYLNIDKIKILQISTVIPENLVDELSDAISLMNNSLEELNLMYSNTGDDIIGKLFKSLLHTEKNPSRRNMNLIDSLVENGRAKSLTHTPTSKVFRGLHLEMLKIKKEKILSKPALLSFIKSNFTNFSKLKVVSIIDCAMGDKATLSLANFLKGAPDLETLDLKMNKIGDEGAKALAKVLSKKLSTLLLSYNNIGEKGTDALVVSLTNISNFSIDNNPIGDNGAAALAKALPSMSGLKNLELLHNNIGSTGATAVATALSCMKNELERFNISNNQISDDGAIAIARVLPSMCKLVFISFESNRIGAAGASYIAKTLPSMKALRDLSLAHNCIGDKGASYIAKALPSMKALRDLSLVHNLIGDEGATALAEALPSMKALRDLSLAHNLIGDAGACALAKALKQMTRLIQFCIDNNKIGHIGRVAINNAFNERYQG